MDRSCWIHVYGGTLLRLVFSRLGGTKGAGCPVGTEVNTSAYIAPGAVLVCKLWLLNTSRSNPFCMYERLGCRFCLAWLIVEVREQVNTWLFLGMNGTFEPHECVY